MRTAKYHDYAILKVVILFLIIVIGLFAYKTFVKPPCVHTAEGNAWVTEKEATCTEDGARYKKCSKCGEHFDEQIIPALGHKAGSEVVIEKSTCTKQGTAYKACTVCKKQVGDTYLLALADHTYGNPENGDVVHTTEGASYEKVVTCTKCGFEAVETVDVEHTIKTSTTTHKSPTCTDVGIKYTTTSCVECDKVLSVTETPLAPLGHSFDWKLNYNGAAAEFTLSGVCTTSGCGHRYDPEVDSEYTFSEVERSESESLVPTCVSGYDTFVTTIYRNGNAVATVSIVIDLDPVHNHTIVVKGGESVDFMTLAELDDNGEAYINISTYGVYLMYTVQPGQTEKEAMAAAWDEFGFAYGVFKCTTCNEWIVVRVFNDLA